MGGYGSGRPRTRAIVESLRVLDVNQLNRSLALPAYPSASDEIRLSFQALDTEGNWIPVAQTIPIVRAPCRFGGTRPFFECRGHWRVGCGRRAVKLYRGTGFYLCRRCLRAGYASESEDDMDRAWRSAGKIKARLGGDPDCLAPFPPKPKGMWWRTYERMWWRHEAVEQRIDDAFDEVEATLLRRLR